jgi:zinc transport system substrate-binding protein
MRYIISSAVASLAFALPAFAEVPKVVTDIHPVHALVAQVMGDLGRPELLLERGASEHDFQLRPSQAAGLAEADLVVWIGPDLTPWLDRALEGIGGEAARLGLLAVPGTVVQDWSEDGAHGHEGHDHGGGEGKSEEAGHDHDHGHDHGADGAKAEEGHDHGTDAAHGHAHEGVDPHAWLEPENAKVWLTAIAAKLAELDPENAATYAANAEAAVARVDAVDAEVAALLEPVKGKPVVVYHDAYGYFVAHYGLEIFGSVALGDATAPGAARLSALRDGVAGGVSVCVFPEAQHDPALIEQLAEGTGAKVGAALDPNGSMQEPGPGAWEGTLRALAVAMADCVAAE